MLLCNPNAAYYEYIRQQTDWIEFYMNKDFNIIMWNYRGYGRSEGKPRLSNICKDAEYIIHHMRSEKRLTGPFGVHGTSLGGSVAAYVGKHCKVDFLFSDRSFASATEVARVVFGGFVAFLVKLLLWEWNHNPAQDFFESPCYKLIGFDAKDKVITDNASLRNGVTKLIVGEKLQEKLAYENG